MEVNMKKYVGIISIFLLVGIFLQSQTLQTKPPTKKLVMLSKIYVKVLCMNKWDDGRVTNTAMVVLREGNQSGPVINNASVMVNGRTLSFNTSINEYMGNIGTLTQGQKVPISIKTRDKRNISGYVQASYFVRITSPRPFVPLPILSLRPVKGSITVKWIFSNGGIYLVVFKILRGETQLFSTDVNGSSYTINLKALGLKVLPTDGIKARVISPWTDNFHFVGLVAPGSKGQFFTSATVSIRLRK
jgi:hypothetical protein